MTEPTADEIARWAELCEQATPGPWWAAVGSGPKRRQQQIATLGVDPDAGDGPVARAQALAVFAGMNGHRADDAEFCAEARTAVPRLLALVAAQADQIAELTAEYDRLRWSE